MALNPLCISSSYCSSSYCRYFGIMVGEVLRGPAHGVLSRRPTARFERHTFPSMAVVIEENGRPADLFGIGGFAQIPAEVRIFVADQGSRRLGPLGDIGAPR
eukprot:GHVU01001157.1.p2 GENE.GHVU01001157.1~~GHVU01001157.1.p2  ORF type:complete len:102 (-),score=3.37 GHVU01001157.1:326-631(-)